MAKSPEKSSSTLSEKEAAYISQKIKIYNINFIQYSIMNVLYEKNDISQQQLAEVLALNKREITKAVKGLIAEGYIERITDEKDKRAYKINPTTKGEAVKKAILGIKDKWNKQEKD